MKKRISKKRIVSAGAATLAATVVSVWIWNYFQPISVQAKESFSGIGKVVESYNADNPFIILDIVPGGAEFTYTFSDDDGDINTPNPTAVTEISLATMPYLTAGETPAEQAVLKAITDNPTAFYQIADRAALAEALIPTSVNVSGLNVKYEEGYGGIPQD